jgi:hypothetical protein
VVTRVGKIISDFDIEIMNLVEKNVGQNPEEFQKS